MGFDCDRAATEHDLEELGDVNNDSRLKTGTGTNALQAMKTFGNIACPLLSLPFCPSPFVPFVFCPFCLCCGIHALPDGDQTVRPFKSCGGLAKDHQIGTCFLPVCRAEDIPMVDDAQHYHCNPDERSIEEKTARAIGTGINRPCFTSRIPSTHAKAEKVTVIKLKKQLAEKWLVYILRCADGSLYTGITNNLDRRVKQHNAGTASRYTRSRLPVRLQYHEEAKTKGAALKRELVIKTLSRAAKEKLIQCGN